MELPSNQFLTYALAFGDYSVPFAAILLGLDFLGTISIGQWKIMSIGVGPYVLVFLFGYLILNGSAAAVTTTWFKLRQYRTGIRCFTCGLAVVVTETYECPKCGPLKHGKK